MRVLRGLARPSARTGVACSAAAVFLLTLFPLVVLADDYSGEYAGSGTLCEPLNGFTCQSILGDITVGGDGSFDAHGLSGSVDSSGTVTGSYDDGSGNVFPVTGSVIGNVMTLHAQKGRAYADWTLKRGGISGGGYLGAVLLGGLCEAIGAFVVLGPFALLLRERARAAMARTAIRRRAAFQPGRCPPRRASDFGLPAGAVRTSSPGWRVKQHDGRWRSLANEREKLRPGDTNLVRWHAGDDYYYAEPDADGNPVATSVPFAVPAAGVVRIVKGSAYNTINLFVLGPDGKPGKIAFQFLHARGVVTGLDGKRVDKGTVLGWTGNSSKPGEPVPIHLHVQARDFSRSKLEGQLVDPDCVYPRAPARPEPALADAPVGSADSTFVQ